MPLSSDVSLPKTVVPKFPDRCVACYVENPGGTFRASTHSVGWWTYLFWMFGSRFTMDVPACEACQRIMTRQKWIRRLVNTACIIAAASVAFFLLMNLQVNRHIKKWLVMGLALALLLPLFLWELFFPKVFDMTATSNDVVYEFASEEYAQEFLKLNGDITTSDS